MYFIWCFCCEFISYLKVSLVDFFPIDLAVSYTYYPFWCSPIRKKWSVNFSLFVIPLRSADTPQTSCCTRSQRDGEPKKKIHRLKFTIIYFIDVYL